MQLISLPASPFAARVRIAIYAKDLPIALAAPPANWLSDPQFRSINPIGRVPVLLLEDGSAIQESSVILEYLEERFPDARPLLPAAPELRARARLLARIADLYLMPPMVGLAGPIEVGEARTLIAQLVDGLSMLEAVLEPGRHSVGHDLSIADCALAPVLFAVRVTAQRMQANLLGSTRRVSRYVALIAEDPHVRRVLREMNEALRELSSARR